jgi:hypothetical protein
MALAAIGAGWGGGPDLGEVVRRGQLHVGPEVVIVDLGSSPRIEDVDRVGDAVAGQGKDRLVHHHHRHLPVGHGTAVIVAQREIEDGLASRSERPLTRRHLDGQATGHRRDG